VGFGLYNVPWMHEVVYITLVPKQVTADNRCMEGRMAKGSYLSLWFGAFWRLMSDKNSVCLSASSKSLRSGVAKATYNS